MQGRRCVDAGVIPQMVGGVDMQGAVMLMDWRAVVATLTVVMKLHYSHHRYQSHHGG